MNESSTTTDASQARDYVNPVREPGHARSFYRLVAIAEAVTWTGLVAGMVLKYAFDMPVAVLIACLSSARRAAGNSAGWSRSGIAITAGRRRRQQL